ncbi:hypothetical protein LTR10_015761 [Elasticomyces elasticus]|uniref:Uncharacterized protein n=1 Tax=Exophiala sideris TaxID=1016849 RepID=A0ABR0IYC5_9EURO|nr:hypothetical protein LTR10_015761 [Elasticomyces elasticus]KAK5022567.1 hypothetical protein LTS07_010013 [Exophiala sideris]KAK5028095.1 hypothetical protein LTR13_009324 [Exophiala sideris]KAK5051836.1 hypothetical protein LTR69_010127 [Exophiala sideris]KAK5177832.1 hypothetical protein LTR44_009597 [Eurotiomycetes sp. CCFEE 6388]
MLNVDAPQLDDKMDVASSPFRQPDDIDIDLDSVRDSSIIGSIHDDMIDDDPVQLNDSGNNPALDEADELLPDDDMFDDMNPPVTPENADIDYNMDGDGEGVRLDEDEDILYEEEEDMPVEPPVEITDHAEEITLGNEPQQFDEGGNEVNLLDIEEHIEDQQLTTNLAHIESNQDTTDVTEQEPKAAAQAQSPLPELETETERPENGEQDNAGQDHDQAEEHHESEDDVSAAIGEINAPGPAVQSAKTTLAGDARTSASNDSVEEQEDIEHQVAEHTDKSQEAQASLHPVTLVYLDEEMSLFPPMLGDSSAVYFLQDSSLAFEPLDKVLAACREILSGTLDHHDELVLDITSLGLHICEDSKYAAQITLSQILDVYLQLCSNDGNDKSPPLYCYLSSRVSLASQYAYLSSACGEGRGFSEIAADYVDTPEPEAEPAYHEHDAEGDANQKVMEELPIDSEDPVNVTFAGETRDASQPTHNAPDHVNEPEDTTESAEHAAEDAKNLEDVFALAEADEEQPADISAAKDTEGDDVAPAHDSSGVPEDDPDGEGVEAEAADVGHDPRSELSDPSRVAVDEDETNSSHTVQADHVEFEAVDLDAVHVETEGETLFNDFQHHAQDLEHDPVPELDSFSDEELFVQEDDSKDDLGDASIPAEHAGSAAPDSQQHLSAQPQSDPSSLSLKPPTAASPPITPSKTIHSKRKVEDDDDFDLLEFDTPEPKRRRPS